MATRCLMDDDHREVVGRRDVLVTGSAAVMALLAACGGGGTTGMRADADCPTPGSGGRGGAGGAGGGTGAGGSAGGGGAGGLGGAGGDGADAATPDALDDDAAGDGGPLVCDATEDNVEGPFYKEGAPEKNVFADDATPGTRLVLSGHVLDPQCRPIPGAALDFWQANNAGEYDAAGFAFRGKITVGADGAYELRTVIPGRYLDNGGTNYRAQHVHAKLTAPGFAPLTTQLFFDGDPFLRTDPFTRASQIVTLSDEFRVYALGHFDFVLARAAADGGAG